MANCIFCCKTRPQKVILFKEETFRKCQEVLEIRKDYEFKYHDIELPTELDGTQGYHTNCYKYFTALKQKYYEPKTVLPNLTNLKVKTESDCDEVVVDRVCFFCGRRQKMKRNTRQCLHAGPKNVFLDRVKNFPPCEYNEEIIKKLESLTTNTLFYHSSCRIGYYDRYKLSIKSVEVTMWHARRRYHRMAYKQMCSFVELNVLDQGTCYFLSQLLDEYLNFLRQIAETNSDVFDKTFTAQHLEQKLLKTFGKDIKIIKNHYRKIVAPRHVNIDDGLLYYNLEKNFRLVQLLRVKNSI